MGDAQRHKSAPHR
ncbi:hypothetical protein CVE24_22905, partial [Pseudomonas syringae pv. actinidiae]|nr:hypothetical protein [Pseudomonas syringae pv. actinidiae]